MRSEFVVRRKSLRLSRRLKRGREQLSLVARERAKSKLDKRPAHGTPEKAMAKSEKK